MGGASVILMLAAVGITYGWQPDASGGVEYVVQIPPEQLHELERIGEITSVIDPAVQGHVSRVIVKVGNSKLPRITPPNLQPKAAQRKQSAAVIAAADHSPVPIPEMEDVNGAIPIRSLDITARPDADTAVMKPDVNDPAGGPGFSLPSSLRESATANGYRNGIDRAGREIGNPGSDQRGGFSGNESVNARGPLVAPPSTRTPSTNPRTQAPPFTGGGNPTTQLAQTTASGPSTDPTNTGNSAWRDFSGRNLAGSQARGPTTEPVGRSDQNAALNNRSTIAPGTAGSSVSSGRGASGLSPSDNFGKMPGGLTFPTGNENRSITYADQYNRSAYGQGPQANQSSSFQNPNLQGSNSADIYSQQQQTLIDRQSQYPGQGYGAANVAANSSLNDPFSGNARNQQESRQNVSPDPRLTAAQIAAGAWTVDVYGRPIDRDGRLIPTNNVNASTYDRSRMQSQTTMSDVYADRATSSLGRPSVNASGLAGALPAGSNLSQIQSQNQDQNPFAYGSSSAGNTDASARLARDPDPTNRSDLEWRRELARRSELASRDDLVRAGAATSDYRQSSASIDSTRRAVGVTGRGMETRHVAAQPLFNGLLLISFVANVYLIFWLKNLRVQFRDLVAAKRMAGTGGSPT